MKLLASLILGISAIISAALIGDGLTDLRTGDRYVTVKGVAEREVNADLALWPIRFVATGASLSEAQDKARSSRDAIMAFLKLQAIDQDAKAELGGLRRANQGVFQILARDQAPGIMEGQQPVKTVRVVSTVEYYLR
ncbi:hypothetical protein C9974_01950 [Marinobacter sp. B9-2]|jgi:hypothetical protein|nr:hypothetical protein C9974_01950 [Marinobacter sp. B9-2]